MARAALGSCAATNCLMLLRKFALSLVPAMKSFTDDAL
jgi:hypothetical protein